MCFYPQGFYFDKLSAAFVCALLLGLRNVNAFYHQLKLQNVMIAYAIWGLPSAFIHFLGPDFFLYGAESLDYEAYQ